MLHELHIEYKNGRTEHKIIHTNPGEQVILYPQQDGIKFANHKSFKYRVKQPKMCIAIINLGDNTYIYPDKIICHPKTTIDDIEVIQTRVNKPRAEKPKTWVFESSSGGGIYEVRMTPNGLSGSSTQG